MPKRLKVLLSAYACEPNRGSEPEVGWQWALHLARHHDVFVVTRSNNEPVIRESLKSIPQPHPEFLYYDPPRFWLRWKSRGMPVSFYYLVWQLGLRWKLRSRLKEFELVHHLTFNSFRQPGFWWLCPCPVILGPLGGGQFVPWEFMGLMRGTRLAETIRSLGVISASFWPQLWISFGSAAKILVANEDTQARIPVFFRSKTFRMLETGIRRERIAPRPAGKQTTGCRFMWVSWFDRIKAPELALRGFASAYARNKDLSLTMTGGGPLLEPMKELATQLGIADAVSFTGRLPHPEIPKLLSAHDAFIFTSLRDTSGNVLIEAMAAGLPAITLLHQGAAEIATEETAIRVIPRSPAQTVEDIATAILKLAALPELRTRLGEAAQQRLWAVYAWDRKAEEMSSIYDQVTRNGQQASPASHHP